MKLFDVPEKTTPDWAALAAYVLANGPVRVSPDYEYSGMYHSLRRFGVAVYSVQQDGKRVAWSIEEKRSA